MSRSIKKLATQSLKVIALGSGAILTLLYTQAILKLDPLSPYRRDRAEGIEEQGIRMEDVHLVQYSGDKKVAEARVDQVFIPRDRRQYRMAGIRSGTYFPESGKPVQFSAPRAIWTSTYRRLNAEQGVRIWNPDMDIKTANFRIDGRNETLYAPGKISGVLYNGQVTATNLLYNVKTEVGTVGPSQWDGNLAVSLQDDGKAQPKRWKFNSENGTINIKGDIRTWRKGTATDGEVIIRADVIEHNNKTDVVTATGHVQYFSASTNLACDKVVAYRKEKRAILTGAVDMLVKPKDQQTKAEIVEIPPFRPIVPKDISEGRPDAPPAERDPQQKKLDQDVQDPKTLRKYPIAITASKIEYWYGKGNRHAVITGEPQARQELPGGRWRHLWAFEAFYDGEKETLRMASRPGKADTRLQSSLGDNAVAEEVTVSTKEDDEDLEAKGAKGEFYGTSDDDDDTNIGIKPPDPLKPPTKGGLKGPIGGGTKTPPTGRL
ncbi:MAG: hypothetical protein BGO01_21130 [Armatimonadetes bacterium 55-13]|nr:hypothetical protein [Armatimonadota bacterium]OJU64614.1 MAG: hypothetical protein BGO01_21130 [Armatimonadetes bacterium 55-13]